MKFFKKLQSLVGLLLLIFVFSPITVAQDIEKRVTITKKYGGDTTPFVAYALYVTESYNSDMTIDGYSFLLAAQNDKYDVISDLFPIVRGNAQNIYNFTKWVLSFIDVCNVEDVKIPIEDFTFPLSIKYVNWKLMGKRYIIRNDSSYHIFKKSEFEKIQKELLKYCKKQGIAIDTNFDVDINPAYGKKT